VHSNDIKMVHDVDESDDVQDVKEVSTAVEDVSGVIFVIIKWCMLGLVAVIYDATFVS